MKGKTHLDYYYHFGVEMYNKHNFCFVELLCYLLLLITSCRLTQREIKNNLIEFSSYIHEQQS